MIASMVTIAGQDVSDYVKSIRLDQGTQKSDPAKLDMEIVNMHGQYSGKFLSSDTMEITLINDRKRAIDTIFDHHEAKVFTGQVGKIAYDPEYVTIEGACQSTSLAEALPKDLGPFVAADIEDIVKAILKEHDPPITKIKIQVTQKIKEDQMVFKAGLRFHDALDQCANLVGAIWYFDEDGTFVFIDPILPGAYIDLTDFVIGQDQTFSTIGHINALEVIGAGYIPAGEKGAENETTTVVRSGLKKNEASIAKHGLIMGPTFYIPCLTTKEECEKRAENLLVYYSTMDDVSHPVVVGRAPPLMSWVTYDIYTVVKGESVKIGTVKGMVTKRVIDFSKDGWYCTLDVAGGAAETSPYSPISDSHLNDPEGELTITPESTYGEVDQFLGLGGT